VDPVGVRSKLFSNVVLYFVFRPPVLWIRIAWIRTHLAVLGTDPDADLGAWKLTKLTNKSGFLPF